MSNNYKILIVVIIILGFFLYRKQYMKKEVAVQKTRAPLPLTTPQTFLMSDASGNLNTVSLVDLINTVLPRGMIVAWNEVADPPIGWAICDGTQGTPDLRDRFILGGGSTQAGPGGSANQTLTVDNLPSHTHSLNSTASGTIRGVGNLSDRPWGGDATLFMTKNGVDTLNAQITSGPETRWKENTTPILQTDSNGNATPFSIVPPYYCLYYIMKL